MDWTHLTGSGSLSMMKDPKAQQGKVGPAVHAAFHKLKPINMALDQTI